MPRTLAPATRQQAYDTAAALDYLRSALALLKHAGHPRTVERVRAAIRSADGAVRHVERRARQSGVEPLPYLAQRRTGAAAPADTHRSIARDLLALLDDPDADATDPGTVQRIEALRARLQSLGA